MALRYPEASTNYPCQEVLLSMEKIPEEVKPEVSIRTCLESNGVVSSTEHTQQWEERILGKHDRQRQMTGS